MKSPMQHQKQSRQVAQRATDADADAAVVKDRIDITGTTATMAKELPGTVSSPDPSPAQNQMVLDTPTPGSGHHVRIRRV